MLSGRYLATFAPGFEGVIADLLSRHLPGSVDVRVFDGMALFSLPGSLPDVRHLAFLNNLFLVLREWNTSSSGFADLSKAAAGKSDLSARAGEIAALAGSSFRVRFSKENQFCSVDKSVTEYAERSIAKLTGLASDRENPGMEFWFIIRRENLSFFAARLTKKPSTEKYLEKGELRPEIVQLVTALARLAPEDRVLLDPFAGHGAIPEQLALAQRGAVVHASDIDPALGAVLARRFSGNGKVRVHTGDALHMDWIAPGSVDVIVTDPPWGFWDSDSYKGDSSIENLYRGMLAEFARVLSVRGRALVMTGAKNEMLSAVLASPEFALCAGSAGFRTDILVNGKKSAVFALSKQGADLDEIN
jgi:hypothetical protein